MKNKEKKMAVIKVKRKFEGDRRTELKDDIITKIFAKYMEQQ